MKLLGKKISRIAMGTLGSIGLFVQAASAHTVSAAAFAVPQPPAVQAKSVVLMDAANGQILYEKNPDARRAPASTTKLMTMLLIIKAVQDHKISWNTIVPVTPDAYKVAVEPGVSDAYLDPREKVTLLQMMRYIAVISANDATVAVADKIGGDKSTFASEMNAEAQKLGLTGTHYMNPDGLTESGHYTTARDLAVLARYIVNNYPQVLDFTSEETVTAPKDVVRSKPETWINTDRMIGHYPGVDGLKTGYTSDAGYCFVGTAVRNGRRLISVVMGDTKTNENQRFVDTGLLFDYGFNQFSQVQPVKRGETLSQTVSVKDGKLVNLPVQAQDSITVDLPTGVKGKLVLDASSQQSPVRAGQKVGVVKYEVNGQTLVETNAVASEADPKANFLTLWFRSLGHWLSHLLHHNKG